MLTVRILFTFHTLFSLGRGPPLRENGSSLPSRQEMVTILVVAKTALVSRMGISNHTRGLTRVSCGFLKETSIEYYGCGYAGFVGVKEGYWGVKNWRAKQKPTSQMRQPSTSDPLLTGKQPTEHPMCRVETGIRTTRRMAV